MSGTIVFILVYAATAPLTPASFTSYWCMLAILHAKMIDMPLALATYRKGLAALGSFQSFLSQPSSWQPDITQAERRAAAALLEQGGAAGAASPEAWPSYSKLVTVAAYLAAREAVEARPDSLAAMCWCSWCAASLLTAREDTRSSGPGSGKGESEKDGVGCCEVRIAAGSEWRWREAEAEGGGGRIRFAEEGGARALALPAGGLTVLQGEVGSGKSTLLHGLLGEAPLRSGGISLHVPRGGAGGGEEGDAFASAESMARPPVAYVAQSPWLLNTTIKANVLWDASFPFDEARYQQACDACCLLPDLAALRDGDATIVGDGGENLSGGQRQRVALARAAYSKAPLLLLDDVLSALDAVVASRVMDRCVLGMMAGRTRLLVSHSQVPAPRPPPTPP